MNIDNKKTTATLLISLLLMMMPFSVQAGKADDIRIGMTRVEVRRILGTPTFRQADTFGERWKYVRRYHYLNGDDYIIDVRFRGDAVDHVDTYRQTPSNNDKQGFNMPYDNRDGYNSPYGYGGYGPAMNERDFSTFYKYVKGETFKDSRMKLLTVGCLDNYFTCEQCSRMMQLYTFDDDRLDVLRLMAGHLVDTNRTFSLLQLFTFDSSRQKAGQLLERSYR